MLPSLSFDQDEIPLVSLSCCIYRGDTSGKLSQLLRLNLKNSIAKHSLLLPLVENKYGILPCSLQQLALKATPGHRRI